ncbi:hypothetical protein BDV36DRAFT_263220 [Aspergillus pseudocaelatus]|uniref:Uncharacterized protein n=1 Tax=Aspergillus pseudocaelatus TaxID=1825620 RepID=A0ABQ6WDV7_9EURO|nr:hypothetical protein BDV36DRAFT_263220 [Aspergillus pseudocaelatus]
MSTTSEFPLYQKTQCILKTIRSLTTETRHSEIWGTDLNHAEPRMVESIIQKFLQQHSIIPSLQVPKARYSLSGH